MDQQIMLFDERTNQIINMMLNSNNCYFSSFADIINRAQYNVLRSVSIGKKIAAYTCYASYGFGNIPYLIKHSSSADKTTVSITMVEEPNNYMQLTHLYDTAKLTVLNNSGQKIVTCKVKKDSLSSIREESENKAEIKKEEN